MPPNNDLIDTYGFKFAKESERNNLGTLQCREQNLVLKRMMFGFLLLYQSSKIQAMAFLR